LIIAVCSDHGRGEAKGDGLQHHAFGGMSGFEANIAVATVSVFYGSALKDCCNADACRRGRDPILTEGGVDERRGIISGRLPKRARDDPSRSDAPLPQGKRRCGQGHRVPADKARQLTAGHGPHQVRSRLGLPIAAEQAPPWSRPGRESCAPTAAAQCNAQARCCHPGAVLEAPLCASC